MSGGIYDKTIQALQSSANFRQLRQNITTSNIANAETPGYTAKKVDFEDALARAVDIDGKNAMATSDPVHFPTAGGPIGRVKADVYDNPDGQISNDGNTVDMEKEMSTLAENSIMYKAAIQLINKKLAALKYATSEGSR